MKYRITVDPDLCIGAASCATVAPESFVMNVENKAEVLDHGHAESPSYMREVELTAEELQNVILGAQSCPTMAISIVDENNNTLYPL
jgi:ferredoxin